jgi:hypothetical protein
VKRKTQAFALRNAVKRSESSPTRNLSRAWHQWGESEIRNSLGNTPGEFRIQSHTSNLLNQVRFSDLKFLILDAMEILGTSNPPH